MERGYWNERWEAREIGFHTGDVNPLLARFVDRLAPGGIYVPMCGKARDLTWLAQRGFAVVGSEWIERAGREYFDEAGVSPIATPHGPFLQLAEPDNAAPGSAAPARTTRGVRLMIGDAFALPEVVPSPGLPLFDSAFDRASLVAIDPARREAYVEALHRVLRPGGTVLLITFAYDQTCIDGPPWSVDEAAVHALYAPRFVIEHLATEPTAISPRLAAAGIRELAETAYLLTHR